jgi:hypothetical protein
MGGKFFVFIVMYTGYEYGDVGSWGTLSAVCFLFSGIFSDFLLVRWCLLLAYLFSIISTLFGFPKIQQWSPVPGSILSVGNLCWSSASLMVQSLAVWRFLWDERPITFRDEDEESVWRCMLRRCGMARMECKLMQDCCQWRTFEPGQVIYLDGQDIPVLNLIFEGIVHLTYQKRPKWMTVQEADSNPAHSTDLLRKGSGQLFDLRLLSLFGVFCGFEQTAILTVMAHTRVRLLTWSAESVMHMASGQCGAALPTYWRSLALYNMCAELSSLRLAVQHTYTSKGDPELAEWFSGGRSADFMPFDEEEEASNRQALKGMLQWIFNSLSIMPPPGMRHKAGPSNAAMVRNRLLLEQEFIKNGSCVPQGLS